MTTNFKNALAALLVCTLLSACAGVPIDFKGHSVTDRAQVDLSKGRKISAQATGFQLLLLIPIALNGRQAAAYEDLLAQAGDDVLSDITVTESWRYAFVGTMYTTTIEATAYPRAATPASK